MPRSLTDYLLLQGMVLALAIAGIAFRYAWRHGFFEELR